MSGTKSIAGKAGCQKVAGPLNGFTTLPPDPQVGPLQDPSAEVLGEVSFAAPAPVEVPRCSGCHMRLDGKRSCKGPGVARFLGGCKPVERDNRYRGMKGMPGTLGQGGKSRPTPYGRATDIVPGVDREEAAAYRRPSE